MGLQRLDQTAPTERYSPGIGAYPGVAVQQPYRGDKAKAQGDGGSDLLHIVAVLCRNRLAVQGRTFAPVR